MNELKDYIDHLNQKHYRDIVGTLDNPSSGYNQLMEEIRALEVAQNAWKAGGKKGNRLLAVLTPEQDLAFSRAYGPTYFRNKKFFTEMFPQTLALNRRDL